MLNQTKTSTTTNRPSNLVKVTNIHSEFWGAQGEAVDLDANNEWVNVIFSSGGSFRLVTLHRSNIAPVTNYLGR